MEEVLFANVLGWMLLIISRLKKDLLLLLLSIGAGIFAMLISAMNNSPLAYLALVQSFVSAILGLMFAAEEVK